MKQISFFEHEMCVWKEERKARRLWALSLALFGGFLASNTAWVIRFFSG